MYINSICSISAAGTITDKEALPALLSTNENRKQCIEPDYKDLIPPMQLRRMSKPVRTGVAAAKICLGEERNLTAINIGTAYGMLQDSENFLDKMISQEEQMLNPTAFIQSTHNTVSGQIALGIQCNAHNMTFVHKGHSVESALLDAQLILEQQPASQILIGAVDECTDTSFEILKQFDIYNDEVAAGEGAHFLLLSGEKKESSIANLVAFEMFRANDIANVELHLQTFLANNNIAPQATDLVVLGNNGNAKDAAIYQSITATFFEENEIVNYKEYSGEYPTAVGFALSLAALEVKDKYDCVWVINNFGSHWSVYCLQVV